VNQPLISIKQQRGKWDLLERRQGHKIFQVKISFQSNSHQYISQSWLNFYVQTLFGCLLQISFILCPIVLLFKNCHECLGNIAE